MNLLRTTTSNRLWRFTSANGPAISRLSLLRTYHEKVIDHYENPRNVGSFNKGEVGIGTGLVGAPACGDVMKLQIKVDEQGKIVDARFKTFGCGSAIASSSLATEWVKGRTLEDALKIRNVEIAKELCLPPVKLHCSMLAEDAIRSAVKDFQAKQKTVTSSVSTQTELKQTSDALSS